jgi:hypothetical protein
VIPFGSESHGEVPIYDYLPFIIVLVAGMRSAGTGFGWLSRFFHIHKGKIEIDCPCN